MEKDTKSLLADCTAGIDLTVTAMHGLLPSVQDQSLRRKLRESMQNHEALREQVREVLQREGGGEKDAAPMRKRMTLLRNSARMAVGGDDTTAAYLIAGSCDSGIKNLCRSRNRFANASSEAQFLADRLIRCEEDLSVTLRAYL